MYSSKAAGQGSSAGADAESTAGPETELRAMCQAPCGVR